MIELTYILAFSIIFLSYFLLKSPGNYPTFHLLSWLNFLLFLIFLMVSYNLISNIVWKSETSIAEELKYGIETKNNQIKHEELPIQNEVIPIDAPTLSQLPELPRGCEVTALAMLLNYAGVKVDKMTLAKQVKKDPTPFEVKNGKIYFGHPNKGFVGDMFSRENPGYGVYHKPIRALAQLYLSSKIIDLTGEPFEVIQQHLSKGTPVWVITNTTYQKLPQTAFIEWHTSEGPINITMREHSVLITGYDEHSIYFNDPLSGKKKKTPKEDFIEAWEQMGKQAITYK
ncbi:C39 family peptidase [Bacillus kexueae]|uniref:C39 family peptidase n=1 Tax=Aeribacillus kexueae TaxID=2078952 RepID=UPI001FAFEDEB